MYFSASDKSFSPMVIWPDSRSISAERYNIVTEELLRGRVLMSDVNGDPYTTAPNVEEVIYTLDETFEMQLDKLSIDYEIASAFLRQGYPKSECDTWTLQIEEAHRYVAWIGGGSTGPSPGIQFISSLWVAREQGGYVETLAELIDKILHNNNIYTPLLAVITGHRHVKERELHYAKASGSKSTVAAVTWDYMGVIIAAYQ